LLTEGRLFAEQALTPKLVELSASAALVASSNAQTPSEA
jgi:hypothetical protein